MKKLTCLSILLLISTITTNLNAQTDKINEIIKPILIEREYLSGLGLPKLDLKAHPERDFFQKRLYRGSELTVFILSSETAENEFESFPIEEFVYFINGKADIEPKNDSKYSFYPKDYIFVPKGFSGKWTNNGGNKYHLELSVISNKRSDSTKISVPKKPFLLDKEILAGIGLTKISDSLYHDKLYSGIELKIITESEEPIEKEIIDFEKEQFIHILSGTVIITAENADSQTFYSGDFFILPKGFSGSWKSSGANLFRTLRVMQIG